MEKLPNEYHLPKLEGYQVQLSSRYGRCWRPEFWDLGGFQAPTSLLGIVGDEFPAVGIAGATPKMATARSPAQISAWQQTIRLTQTPTCLGFFGATAKMLEGLLVAS
jgi:hypothetical protein